MSTWSVADSPLLVHSDGSAARQIGVALESVSDTLLSLQQRMVDGGMRHDGHPAAPFVREAAAQLRMALAQVANGPDYPLCGVKPK